MTYSTTSQPVRLSVFVGLILAGVALFGIATYAQAASYAYVTTTGEVKSVTADDWRTAISIAPGIHMNSGVMLLKEAGDFTIIGDDVSAF